MNMRKGFNLVEMLMVITIIPVAAVILDGFFNTLLRDFPRTSAVVQENKIVLNMLRQMREDIDKATGLPKSFAGQTVSDELLLIKWPGGVICYQSKDGEVLRYRLTDTQEGDGEDVRAWSVPNAEVKWSVWRKNSEGYAVEVKTHVKQKLRKKWQKKMANSHLYFVGAF
ncbi:MAG: type II secretion system protein J [Sedimentisphaerales bacterium]